MNEYVSYAGQWLRGQLREGRPLSVAAVKARADKTKFLWKTVAEAAERIGVKVENIPERGGECWRLPNRGYVGVEALDRAERLVAGCVNRGGKYGEGMLTEDATCPACQATIAAGDPAWILFDGDGFLCGICRSHVIIGYKPTA